MLTSRTLVRVAWPSVSNAPLSFGFYGIFVLVFAFSRPNRGRQTSRERPPLLEGLVNASARYTLTIDVRLTVGWAGVHPLSAGGRAIRVAIAVACVRVAAMEKKGMQDANSVRHSVCCGGGRSEQRQAGNPGNSPSERFTRPCGAGGGPAAPVGTSFRLCWGRDRELTLPTCLSHKRNQPPGQRMLASQASGERELPVFLKRGSLADTAAPQRRAGRSR
ncbi:hypothetical protein SAMN05444166_5175 [Singulisphaera sp. GP187]|nr:hypothetical protein SAMN05444166_5175 [Singulisphaera sp. GP187]